MLSNPISASLPSAGSSRQRRALSLSLLAVLAFLFPAALRAQSGVEVLTVGGIWVSDFSPVVSTKGAVIFVDYTSSLELKMHRHGNVSPLVTSGVTPVWTSDGTTVETVNAPSAGQNGVVPFLVRVSDGTNQEYEVVTYDTVRDTYKRRISTSMLPSNVRKLKSPKILSGNVLVHVVYEDFHPESGRHTADLAVDLASGTVTTVFDSLNPPGPRIHWRGANLVQEHAMGVENSGSGGIVIRELPSGPIQTVVLRHTPVAGGTLLGIENPVPTDASTVFACGANIFYSSGITRYTLYRWDSITGQSTPLFQPGDVAGASRMTGSYFHVPSPHHDLESYIVTVDDGGMSTRAFYRITRDASGTRTFERMLGSGDAIPGHGTITSLGHGVSLTPLSNGKLAFWASTTTTPALLGALDVNAP